MSTNQRQNGLWTVQFGELGATLKALQDNGVTKEQLARLRADPDYAKRVAGFMLRGGFVGSASQKLARAILRKNFFGVEEWSSLYGVNFSNKQLRKVAEFPWDEGVLNSICPLCGKIVKDCHFAFLGLDTFNGKPLTILKWQEIHPETGQPKFCSYASDSWYSRKKFANELTCGFRWYLMPLEIIPNSTDRTYQEQLAMLPAEYEVPFAVEEVTKVILYYRKNGVYLNPRRNGRCRDMTSNGSRVYVGYFDSGGLDVNDWDELCYLDTGLAASRKIPKV